MSEGKMRARQIAEAHESALGRALHASKSVQKGDKQGAGKDERK
jgi:hypothetical protein